MLHLFYHLFIAFCMFVISLSGLLFALSMWRRSSAICDECKKELENAG